jgi:hypothetical protein
MSSYISPTLYLSIRLSYREYVLLVRGLFQKRILTRSVHVRVNRVCFPLGSCRLISCFGGLSLDLEFQTLQLTFRPSDPCRLVCWLSVFHTLTNVDQERAHPAWTEMYGKHSMCQTCRTTAYILQNVRLISWCQKQAKT